jgi:hypothetical protein
MGCTAELVNMQAFLTVTVTMKDVGCDGKAELMVMLMVKLDRGNGGVSGKLGDHEHEDAVEGHATLTQDALNSVGWITEVRERHYWGGGGRGGGVATCEAVIVTGKVVALVTDFGPLTAIDGFMLSMVNTRVNLKLGLE